MPQARTTRSLQRQFIAYALAGTVLPLTVIIVVLLVFQIRVFESELAERIKMGAKVFRQTLLDIERQLRDQALIFTGLLANAGRIDSALLERIFLERAVMQTFQVLEFRIGSKTVFQASAPDISVRSSGSEFTTPEPVLDRYWAALGSLLFAREDVLIERQVIGRLMLYRGASLVIDERRERIGMCVLSRVIDDKFCAVIKHLSGAEVFFYDRKGIPFLSSLFAARSEVARLSNFPELAKLAGERDLVIDDAEIFGKSYAVGYFPLYQGREVIALAAVALDKSRFLDSVTTAIIFLFASMLVLILLQVAIGFYSSRRILGPVYELVSATRSMADGQEDVRIKTRPSNELGELVDSFNVMAAAVNTHQEIMANYNMTLTDAIEERTAELEKAQNSLVHAKKMASLGQLTAGIAHEIKNPLNFINNFTETNIDFVNELEGALAGKLDGPDGDEVRDLLADLKENSVIIRKEGEKVSSIIRGMLNQSREDTNAKDEVDINALLHESVNLVYHSARAMRPDTLLDIERQLAAELAPVVANSSQINRVFVNILDNAAYATWEKAKGAGPDYRPLVVIRSREQAGNIVVEIEDNGNGVPEEIRERIFDPFFTTKPAQQGTGLGLKMCYDIIREGHDGSIEIESEPGRFARFIIKIPRQGRHS